MPLTLSLVRLLLPMTMTALALTHSSSAGAADRPSPEAALEAYVSGLRTGSLAKLQELFLADGQFCNVSTQPKRHVVCKRFSEVLGSWASKPDPLTSGRVLHRNDATPSMSAITYELIFAGTRYIDQLLLYQIDGRWQVVAKTTTVQ
jgi:hypothetical protein